MTSTCPLPIDWLDYLHGSGPAEAARHLSACPACREVLNRLKAGDYGAADSSDWLDGIPLIEGKAWLESKPDEVVSGQVWFSAASFESQLVSYEGLDRLPLVIVNTPHALDTPIRWLDVVPLWIDVENAGPSDVVLDPRHTSLGTGFRLLLEHQTTIAVDQLDGCVGAFTLAGEQLLGSVWAGDSHQATFGTAFESGLDDRLHADEWIKNIVQQLGAYYAVWTESAEATEEARRQGAVRVILPFKLQTVAGSKASSLRLAAETTVSGDRLRAVLETAGIALSGYLIYRVLQAQLGFTVERAEGILSPVRITVRSKRISEPFTSAPFLPEIDTEVVLAEGVAIFPQDVEAMELVLTGG